MLSKLILTVLAVSLLSSCRSIDCTDDLMKDNFKITLSKGACMGACPVYSGTVHGDRSVVYDGRMNTEHEGMWYAAVDRGTLCDIRTMIDEQFVMSMKEDQLAEVQDAPMTTLAITYKGQSRVIRWNLGTPEGLRPLVNLMIEVTHENQELRQDPVHQD